MRHVLCLLALVLIVASSQAQEPVSAPAATPTSRGITGEQPADSDPVHTQLRKLQVDMESALNKGDLDALLANVDDTVVFTAMNAGVGRGKEGIREYFNKMMVGPDRIVQSVQMDFIPDALSVFYGPDVAVSSGNAPARYVLSNGMDFEVNARWTATLVRRDGRWLVATFHYSTNMFKNPVLDMQRKWLLMAGGGAALVLGLIGFIVGRKTGRRKA